MMETMNEFVAVPLWNVKPSRWQPREAEFDAAELYELAQSIRDNGLINPVLVFADDDADGYVVWELIAGERRTRATAALRLAELFPNHTLEDWCGRLAHVGLHGMGVEEHAALRGDPTAKIAATVHAGRDMQRIHVMAVIENLDRAALSPIEEGRAYVGLMQAYGWSQREVAGHVNKSQGYVAQRIGLTNLNETAANALNTRVITMTHARAISAVPEALQVVATEYVVHEVVRDDTPATTRQIENQLKALTAFLDPQRWLPNGEKVYMPQERNRLAVIRMLVSGPYAEERFAKNWNHLRAFDTGYEKKNLLTAQPSTIIRDSSMFNAVTQALGMQSKDAWQNHAVLEHKDCSTCVFSGKQPAQLRNGMEVPCPRWRDAQLTTCENWIGGVDPLVIQVKGYYVRQELEQAEALHKIDLGTYSHNFYTDDITACIAAYDAAVAYLAQKDEEKVEEKTNGPRNAIAEFWAWQKTLPGEWLQHSQAHWCALCRYHEPMHDEPCWFAQHPLTEQWGSGMRPPGLGVLFSPTLMMLPRCEMFTVQQLPRIYQQPGFCVGEDKAARRRVMAWMRGIKPKRALPNYYNSAHAVWREVFAWLYPGNGKGHSWDDIEAWLLRNWDEIGDGGMATLITALLYETRAGYERREREPVELVDLRFGSIEPWMPVLFKNRGKKQDHWPDGWMKPWEVKA